MMHTPVSKNHRQLPSSGLGAPSRLARASPCASVPEASPSPSACSAASLENDRRQTSSAIVPVATPSGTTCAGAQRRTPQTPHFGGNRPRDPRPLQDKTYVLQSSKRIVEFLAKQGFGRSMSDENFVKAPSTKEFFDTLRFVMRKLDPMLEFSEKGEEDVPHLMKRLKYPVEVNKSKLQAINLPSTWHQMLGVLDWLITLAEHSDSVIQPLADCDIEKMSPELDESDFQLLNRMQQNYTQYLRGENNGPSDEDQLRDVFAERTEAFRGEIARLEAQISEEEQRLAHFETLSAELHELQELPKRLELEKEEKHADLQGQEAKMQRLEVATRETQAEYEVKGQALEELQLMVQRLTEQVKSQVCTKGDIERFKMRRNHLRDVLRDLKAEVELANKEVWDLGMEESRVAEEVERAGRRIAESGDVLERTLVGASQEFSRDQLLQLPSSPLSQPTEVLIAIDFSDARSRIQETIANHEELTRQEENKVQKVKESQRQTQEELSERERECASLRSQKESLQRRREEIRERGAAEEEEARRTAEDAEDCAGTVSSAAPQLREIAQVDDLKLKLSALRAKCESDRTQLQEELRIERKRSVEHRSAIVTELHETRQQMESMHRWVQQQLHEQGDEDVPRGVRQSWANRGGC